MSDGIAHGTSMPSSTIRQLVKELKRSKTHPVFFIQMGFHERTMIPQPGPHAGHESMSRHCLIWWCLRHCSKVKIRIISSQFHQHNKQLILKWNEVNSPSHIERIRSLYIDTKTKVFKILVQRVDLCDVAQVHLCVLCS